jgi:cation transport regulator
MPYASIIELPDSVRNHLPEHAQEIFVAAFNNVWQSDHSNDAVQREQRAFRIAWAAVKHRYRKRGGKWVAVAPLQRPQELAPDRW